VCLFEVVADSAGECQILQRSWPSMALANNMIYLKRQTSKYHIDPAILASFIGTILYFAPQGVGDMRFTHFLLISP
jgi:hypothetical protein